MKKIKYPKTVEDAVLRLKKEIPKKKLEWVKNIKKTDLVTLHHSLGRCIRNEYGLWGRNDELLKACGHKHPDDASFVIIEKLWEDLQNDNQKQSNCPYCRNHLAIIAAMNEDGLKRAARIAELEKSFAHYHVNAHDGTDQCKECGLDLRDGIHIKRRQ